ncbi:MAG TPA: hypothetical protein VLX44_09330, partial [Xanthobacteraceae bacterium]|nr:hypothetical protein [Xanthobacteraceae bacterium]
MFHITSGLFGGLAAVAAWTLVAPSSNPPPAQPVADQTTSVNRAAKGDRLVPPRLLGADRTVATVEVVGIHDAAIVYRDRGGRVLFETDPLSNVTV